MTQIQVTLTIDAQSWTMTASLSSDGHWEIVTLDDTPCTLTRDTLGETLAKIGVLLAPEYMG